MTEVDEAALGKCRKAFEEWIRSPNRLPLEYPQSGDAPTGFNAGYEAGLAARPTRETAGDVVDHFAKALRQAFCTGLGGVDPETYSLNSFSKEAKAAVEALAPKPMTETRAVEILAPVLCQWRNGHISAVKFADLSDAEKTAYRGQALDAFRALSQHATVSERE